MISRFILHGVAYVAFLAPAVTKASSFQTIYAFTGTKDGGHPFGALVADKAGTLYGTTTGGGGGGNGTLFSFIPKSGKFKTLYTFTGGSGGSSPQGALVFDNSGTLYGITNKGGVSEYGTIFRFNPTTKEFTTLYEFTGGSSGYDPYAGLTFDGSGLLYGTTASGGTGCSPNGCGWGTIFEFNLQSGAYSTLYNFSDGNDGASPYDRLILDKSGDLYGTAGSGGYMTCFVGCGTVFKLDLSSLTLTTLYAFKNLGDGAYPYGGLVFDKKGSLYGITSGVEGGGGTVFKLNPSTQQLSTLYTFTGGIDGGELYWESLVIDKTGALYGTTGGGGSSQCGTVFTLSPKSKVLTTLHTFLCGPDGSAPYNGVVFGKDGELFGPTSADGADGSGTLFEVSP